MFIREEELNSYRRKICVWFRIYLTAKRYHSKTESQITKISLLYAFSSSFFIILLNTALRDIPMCFKTSAFRLGNLKRNQKSTIYTPKQDDKHVRPCHMPAPAPLPKGVRYFWTSQWLLLCQILHKETRWFVNK